MPQAADLGKRVRRKELQNLAYWAEFFPLSNELDGLTTSKMKTCELKEAGCLFQPTAKIAKRRYGGPSVRIATKLSISFRALVGAKSFSTCADHLGILMNKDAFHI